MIETIVTLAQEQEYDRVAVGFPGVVQHGIVKTAVNLDPDWINFDLAATLESELGKPVRAFDGKLVPNLEMGHHPFRKGETYEEQLGREALEAIGKKKWNNRLQKAIACLEHLFNYDNLYIGGGEAKNINFDLPGNAQIVPNVAGLLGGIKLWDS